ncbi:MAG: YkgJ family cysteine cluster protein [Proteobacteria bacterium]|nr:YkgJ family cysteine cluster protein [Pseudomonadota bacterium]
MAKTLIEEASSNMRHQSVDAGDFGSWLAQVQASFRGTDGTVVPCGDCRGCCTSSQFIHVCPQETRTIVFIPKNLLVKAPGLEAGHMVLGFSSDGSCPMFLDNMCSIYEHRPKTCCDYDCRVFAAAGLDAGGQEKGQINKRVRAWQFTYSAERDSDTHHAIKAAAKFIQDQRASFPGGRAPIAPGDIAVLAIKVCSVFLAPKVAICAPAEIAAAIIRASREFEMEHATLQRRFKG